MIELRKISGASRRPDVEAEIYFLPTSEGGIPRPAVSGFRPAHLVGEDYLTTGVHDYLDVEKANPGDTVTATITFITPEFYPHTLWVGKVITVQLGGRIVGHAKITKIFNEMLGAEAETTSI